MGHSIVLIAGGVFYYRSQHSQPLTAKDTVVLSDFSNSTGDAVFDDTLKTALSVSLRQSPFLRFHIDEAAKKEIEVLELLRKVSEENAELDRQRAARSHDQSP